MTDIEKRNFMNKLIERVEMHNEKTVESVCLLSKQRKPDAFLDIEITAEEYEKLIKEE